MRKDDEAIEWNEKHCLQSSISKQCSFNRTKYKTRCNKCIKKEGSSEYNFMIINHSLANYYDRKKNKNGPDFYTPHSNQEVWWKCPKKHSYKMSIKNFVRNDKFSGFPKRGK